MYAPRVRARYRLKRSHLSPHHAALKKWQEPVVHSAWEHREGKYATLGAVGVVIQDLFCQHPVGALVARPSRQLRPRTVAEKHDVGNVPLPVVVDRVDVGAVVRFVLRGWVGRWVCVCAVVSRELSTFDNSGAINAMPHTPNTPAPTPRTHTHTHTNIQTPHTHTRTPCQHTKTAPVARTRVPPCH